MLSWPDSFLSFISLFKIAKLQGPAFAGPRVQAAKFLLRRYYHDRRHTALMGFSEQEACLFTEGHLVGQDDIDRADELVCDEEFTSGSIAKTEGGSLLHGLGSGAYGWDAAGGEASNREVRAE